MEKKLRVFECTAWIEGMLIYALIESVKLVRDGWQSELRRFAIAILALVLVMNGLMSLHMRRRREALLREFTAGGSI